MKRHLKRFKQLLTLTIMVIGLSQSIVTEATAQTIQQPVGVDCDCLDGLPEGWKLLTINFSGTADTDFVIGTGNDIYAMDQSALPANYVIDGVGTDYEVDILVDINADPVFSVGIGFLDASGTYMPLQILNSFPSSCDMVSLDISSVAAPVCASALGTEFTAEITGTSVASYGYEYNYSVTNADGIVVGSGSGTGADNAYNVVTPDDGVYTIQVTASQLEFGSTVPTGCSYTTSTDLVVFDMSDVVAVTAVDGTGEICNTESLVGFNLNIDDAELSTTPTWSLMNDEGVFPVTFVSTGSGTMVDFAFQPLGAYVLSVSGMTDDGCAFSATYDVAITTPGGGITGPLEVSCGTTATYTVLPDGGAAEGTEWVVNGGAITGSGTSTASVLWDMASAGNITASGTTLDGCSYSFTEEVNFISNAMAFSIEGDSHVCGAEDEFEVYTVTSSTIDPDDFGYTWSLFNGATDISATCLTLETTGLGQNQPIAISCLEPGEYILNVEATSLSTPACPDFSLSTTITVADPSIINSIACISGGLNVTIGNSCTLEVTADLLLQGAGVVNNDAYDVVLVDVETGETIDGNILDHSYINKEIEVKVIDQCTGNSCWGNITVEDKSVPALVCPDGNFVLDCEEAADKTLEAYMPVFDLGVSVTYNGDETWTLDGYDNCGEATLTCEDVNQSMGDCPIQTFITRIWTVTDEYGATSTCSFDFEVLVEEEDMIIYPSNYDDVLPGAEPSIDVCSTFDEDAAGNPDPSFTGMPVSASCVEVVVIGYTDVNLELCGADSPARKIIREWTIWNPCGNNGLGEDISYTQYITLTDTEPPICAAFNEFAVVTDSHDCGASIFVPQPEVVTGECSTVYIEMTYKLRDENGFIPALFSDEGVTYDAAAGGFTIDYVGFDSDSLWINFELKDGCGNVTPACRTEIALLDNTPPTPVCDLFNNVALNADGTAYAGPATFDDNSYDNCGVYQTVIKRMDEGAACGACATPRYDFLNFLGEYNGHYYYMSKAPTTGPKSFAYANAVDSYVATIETEAEGSWLHTQVSALNGESYFVGYQATGITNNSPTPNSAFDAQSGGVMNYSNWGGTEPNWTLEGTGDLYVNVESDGNWAAERASISSHYYIVEVEDPCVFSQQVEFCCADVGNEVQVRMRVFDIHGNFAECMVMVDVQDFKAPTVSNIPADISLDCEQLEGTDYLLGSESDHLLTYGEPTFDDICGVTVTDSVVVSTATDCGSFDITRYWLATDTYGNTVSAEQTITVGELTPFVATASMWPQDYDSMNCSNGVEPEDLSAPYAYPNFGTVGGCSNVTSAHTDQVFQYTEIACSKILRTWTVIDWCQPDEVWTHIQVIRIFDDEGPVVVSGAANLTEVEGEVVGACMIETWETGLGLTLTDNCSNYNEITVWYDLDLDSDGTYEVTGVQSDNANGVYPFGTHTIKWYAVDDCGNEMMPMTMTFIVEGESDGPTAYCLTQVVTTIPVAGVAEIWAEDFDAGSYGGTCNETSDLIFSFSADVTDLVRSFDCNSLSAAGAPDTLEMQMYVTDSNGNQSYCTTYLILQDNHGTCGGNGASRASISGKVYTEEGEMVDNVEMSLMAGNPDPMMTYMTQTGAYDFNNVPMDNNYEVNAFNNDNPLNGVSTLDIVLIQRHILGLSPLNSPYKMIAADANNSSSVTAIDLIVIRKLILGLSPDFGTNDSWRFVEQDFVFTDVTSPWPFNETINVNDLDQDMVDEDFIAVKIGDVNNTVVSNFTSNPVEPRSGKTFEMSLRTIELENGNSKVELVAANDGSMVGTQFSISLQGAELMDVIPGALSLTENNFTIANGELLISFDQANGVKVSEDEVLFAVELSNAQSITLTETLRPEVYVDGSGGIEIIDIQLDATKVEATGFALFQNTPNPFSNETTIAFELPSSSVVFIQIFDNSGKVLFADSGDFDRGYNEILVQQSELQTTGILYYQISTDTHIATRKMIVLK